MKSYIQLLNFILYLVGTHKFFFMENIINPMDLWYRMLYNEEIFGFSLYALWAAEIEGKIDGPVLPPSLLVSIKLALACEY